MLTSNDALIEIGREVMLHRVRMARKKIRAVLCDGLLCEMAVQTDMLSMECKRVEYGLGQLHAECKRMEDALMEKGDVCVK